MAGARCQVINAPSDEPPRGIISIFLAGTTSKVDENDWREALCGSLSDVPITIYNPYRADWDSSSREDIHFPPYRQQVEWELEKQDQSDVIVIYLHPATQAPISLLELGLCARVPGKAIVVCPEGYWKRGNVQIVCEKFGVEMVDDVGRLRAAVVKRLPESWETAMPGLTGDHARDTITTEDSKSIDRKSNSELGLSSIPGRVHEESSYGYQPSTWDF